MTLLRLLAAAVGVACIAFGVFPHPVERTAPAGTAASTRSSEAGRLLGLPCSPLFRRTTVVPKATTTVEGRQVVSRHDEHSGWRVHVPSSSAALVVAGTILIVAAARRRARSGSPP